MDLIHRSYYVYGHWGDEIDVLDVPLKSGYYTVNIKRQFLYINICSFSTILTVSTRSHWCTLTSLGQEGRNLTTKQKRI